MDGLKIAVASENPAKIQAVKECFTELGIEAGILPVKTKSGVPAQPFSLEETRQGAVNRASAALAGEVDLSIGLEGGVYEMGETMYLCNWGALASSKGKIYTAGGAQIPLPEEIARELRNGYELGPVMDHYANETGIRHHKGAIGILTANMMNRRDMFGHIIKLLVGQYKLDSG